MAGTGALGLATELVVSRDGMEARILSGPELDVQPEAVTQTRTIAGKADRRISTRTQTTFDSRFPVMGNQELIWLMENYQKKLNPIFTTAETASPSGHQLISQARLSNAAHHATFTLARGQITMNDNDNDSGDFRERIRQNFARQAALHTIGAELTRVERATVEIELPFDVKLTQQHGILHAGVISAALDSACGFAAYSVIDSEASILTIEFKVNLMSPGRGDRFLFRGEITKPGSNIIVADGRGYALSDGPAKLIASMTSTMMIIRGREGITG
jgi:uncharacterized protein (TIGR00369 family)